MSDPGLAAAAAVNEERLWRRLMAMASHGATVNGGVNRQALSAEDIGARRLMLAWADALGLSASTDGIGNLFLRLDGSDADAAPVLTGSHLDSQPTGGKFDGAYGVMAGVEALQAISEAGIETRRPIEVVAWTNEEGSRFQPGCMGSGVFSGDMVIDDLLDSTDSEGITVRSALAELLAATPDLPQRPLGPPAAYLEAHIEQGPILERLDLPIGIVSAVQGNRWFGIEVLGEAAHAGTTPLGQRRDALQAAVRIVSALSGVMKDDSDILRFTVGRFEVEPNAPNTVPSRVFFTIDLRHPEAATIEDLSERIAKICQTEAGPCEVRVERTADTAPCRFDDEVVATLQRSADALELPGRDMLSGAGHDAVYLSEVCPSGMIFVPCEGGVSHNEAENARPEDLAAGTRLLAAGLVALANR